jgi:hypothetical protein
MVGTSREEGELASCVPRPSFARRFPLTNASLCRSRAGTTADSPIVHVEALSSTCILVLFARGGHQLLARVATQVDVRNADVGYQYSKCALRWEASACVLGADAGADSGTRSFLTAKFLAPKGLLAVLSTTRSQGRCDVFAVEINAGANSTATLGVPPAVSFRLAKSESQEGLLTDSEGNGARAFWHTVTQPQLDLLYLVAFSHTQCNLIVIPGNVLRATSTNGGDVLANITVTPLTVPDPRVNTIVTCRGTQSYRKGEVRRRSVACCCDWGGGCLRRNAVCPAFCFCCGDCRPPARTQHTLRRLVQDGTSFYSFWLSAADETLRIRSRPNTRTWRQALCCCQLLLLLRRR